MTYKQATRLFELDAATGALIWRVQSGPRSVVGARAGRVRPKDGYRHVKHGGKMYLEHRVVWLLAYGEWPAGELDHRNGVRDDNRPDNLRPATRTQNNRNAASRVRSLPRGVVFQSGRYIASITVDRKRLYLGSYGTADEAGSAYRAASVRHHGEFAAR